MATTGVAGLVAVVILGPMLAPGFPLRFDLVSVPRPVLGDDALGLGDRLPRAIPLDAATAVLAKVLPDAWLTQSLALLALILAGTGVARLSAVPLPARLVAVVAAQWNPFVLEQLSIGHVPHLLGYGAAPWAGWAGWCLTASRLPGWVSGRPIRPARFYWSVLVLAAAAGSLTAGGGVLVSLSALAGLIAGTRSRPLRAAGWFSAEPPSARFLHGSSRPGWLFVLAGFTPVVLLQLPWLIAAALAPGFSGSGSNQDAGLTAFALRGETGWGRLIDALGLGGMWNLDALPSSRHTVLVQFSTMLVIGLALGGVPHLWSWLRDRPDLRPAVAAGLVACLICYLIAVLPILPGGRGLLSALVSAVPGAGLLRDGHRWLALPALGFAVLTGHAVAGAGAAIGARMRPVEPESPRLEQGSAEPGDPGLDPVARVWRWTTAGLTAALLVAAMPDLAFGLGGRLQAWHYPAQWASIRAELDAAPDSARVLVLPWQPFRQFSWSGGASAVLDPAPRRLPRQTIVSDALPVSGTILPAEGPGARAMTADLARGVLTGAELRALSIGWILTEKGTLGTLPPRPAGWTSAADGPDLELWKGPAPMPAAPRPAAFRAVTVIGAHVLYGGLTLLALLVFAFSRDTTATWAMRRRQLARYDR